jgi:hypothetical protein
MLEYRVHVLSLSQLLFPPNRTVSYFYSIHRLTYSTTFALLNNTSLSPPSVANPIRHTIVTLAVPSISKYRKYNLTGISW